MTNSTTVEASTRLARLLQFLKRDPGNLSLLAEAAHVAFDQREFGQASDLLVHFRGLAPLPQQLVNLTGMIAIAEQRFGDAIVTFTSLHEAGVDDPALRFNLAWSNAMLGSYQDALNFLDDQVLAVSPKAPTLKIQMMHHLGEFEDALKEGERLYQLYPDNEELAEALALLALDADNVSLARHYAEKVREAPAGNTVLGYLALNEQDADRSMALFDNAISLEPANARAWTGKGLGLLLNGDASAGAQALDRGAELFGTHLGSWIASGWAHFAAGNYSNARKSFEQARSIDATFAESYGGLAVMDVFEGNHSEAAKHCEVALRLDRDCFGAALAKTMLLERSGKAELAEKIRTRAMSVPLGSDGLTLTQALIKYQTRRR